MASVRSSLLFGKLDSEFVSRVHAAERQVQIYIQTFLKQDKVTLTGQDCSSSTHIRRLFGSNSEVVIIYWGYYSYSNLKGKHEHTRSNSAHGHQLTTQQTN